MTKAVGKKTRVGEREARHQTRTARSWRAFIGERCVQAYGVLDKDGKHTPRTVYMYARAPSRVVSYSNIKGDATHSAIFRNLVRYRTRPKSCFTKFRHVQKHELFHSGVMRDRKTGRTARYAPEEWQRKREKKGI